MSTSFPGSLVSLPAVPLENANHPSHGETMIATFPQPYGPLPGVAPFRAVLLATVAGALLWALLFKFTVFLVHLF